MTGIDELLAALQDAIAATTICNQAEEAHPNSSWSWNIAEAAESLKQAQARFKEALESYIDSRVAAAIEKWAKAELADKSWPVVQEHLRR